MSESNDDLAIALARRLVERKDVKAFQTKAGAWAPDRSGITMGDLRAHLAGTKTMGHYLVSQDGNCRVVAFDIDLNKTGIWTSSGESIPIAPREVWLDEANPARFDLTVQLRCVADTLARKLHEYLNREFPVAVSYSGGKGLHVYGFIGTMPAGDAREIARDVLADAGFVPSRGDCFFVHNSGYPNITVEVFPKQSNLDGKDLGNLMAMPLGISQKTGQPKFFVDLTKGYGILEADDPMRVLATGSIVD